MSSPRSPPPSTPLTARSPIKRRRTTYRSRMSKRECVDDICSYMRQKHRWSVATFLSYYVAAAPIATAANQAKTAPHRLQELVNNLVNDPAIAPAFLAASKFRQQQEKQSVPLSSYAVKLREELDELQLQNNGRDSFGRLEITSENFGAELLSNSAQLAREHAPELYELLEQLCRPNREDPEQKTSSSEQHKLTVTHMIANISHAYSKINSNALPRILGIYLYLQGVKRRVLEVLHGVGYIEHPATIGRQIDGMSDEAKVSFCTSVFI